MATEIIAKEYIHVAVNLSLMQRIKISAAKRNVTIRDWVIEATEYQLTREDAVSLAAKSRSRKARLNQTEGYIKAIKELGAGQ